MRLITGDECGLLKESIPELSRADKNIQNNNNKDARLQMNIPGVTRIKSNGSDLVEDMCRSRGIVDMAFCPIQKDDGDGGDDDSTFGFCALRANGTVEHWKGNAPNSTKQDRLNGGVYNRLHTINDNVFEPINNKAQKVKKVIDDDNETNETSINNNMGGRPIAICSSLQYQHFAETAHRHNIVACCSSMGLVSILDTNQLDKGVQMQYDVYSKSKNSSRGGGDNNQEIKLTYTKGNFVNRDIATTMIMDHEAKRLVVGGRERAATMLDVETGEKIWKAKNLPPNSQTLLQQPLWSTAMQFLSPTTADVGNNHISTNLLAIGTAFKQLQIYDVRTDATQRRPVLYTPEWDSNKENILDHRITSLCQLDSNRVAVGDTAGFITSLDLRKISNNKKGRSISANVGRFNGSAGSVRQIVKHGSLPIISCVGLDRMLRTYDINSRKELDCVYLKQRLNCVLFCGDDTWRSNDEDSCSDEEKLEGTGEESTPQYYEDMEDDIAAAHDEVIDYVDSSGEESDDFDGDGDDPDASDSEIDEEEEAVENEKSQTHTSKRRKR